MGDSEDVFKDERFKHVLTDPRFKGISKKKRRVGIDKRFAAMFKDKDFNSFATMDPRGRRGVTYNDDMRHLYQLEDSDEEDADTSAAATKTDATRKKETRKTKKTKKKKTRATKHTKDNETKAEVTQAKKSGRGKKAPQDDEDKEHDMNEKESGGADDGSAAAMARFLIDDEEFDGGDEEEEEEEEAQSEDDHGHDDDADDDDEEAEFQRARAAIGQDSAVASNDDEDEGEDEDDDDDDDDDDIDAMPDYARGEVLMSSSSDDSDDDSDVERLENQVDVWAERDGEGVEMTEDVTRRIALCNMDWDNIKATDLLVLASSFKPDTGVVERVDIYLSEFGKERRKLEDEQGPGALIEKALPEDAEAEDADQDKLRLYQLSRLKYFYAVITCDSPATANVIYDTCDGMEYEATNNVLDLRFIPDDMEFEDAPTDSATELPSDAYAPVAFSTPALQNSKVRLTWDEDDVHRKTVTRRRFTRDDLEKMDFDSYVASESEDEEVDVEDKKSAYKALLSAAKEKQADKGQEMTITWNTGLEQVSADLVAKAKKQKEEQGMTIAEKVERLRKEKKAQRRKQQKERKKGKDRDLLSRGGDHLNDDDDDDDDDIPDDPYFQEELAKMEEEGMVKPSELTAAQQRKGDDDDEEDGEAKEQSWFRKGKKKRNPKSKKKRELMKRARDKTTFEEDDRFSALFKSPDFAVDTTSSHFAGDKKGFKDMLNAVEKKRREQQQQQAKRKANPSNTQDGTKKSKLSDDTRDMVEKLKRKAHRFKSGGRSNAADKSQMARKKNTKKGGKTVKKKKKNASVE